MKDEPGRGRANPIRLKKGSCRYTLLPARGGCSFLLPTTFLTVPKIVKNVLLGKGPITIFIPVRTNKKPDDSEVRC